MLSLHVQVVQRLAFVHDVDREQLQGRVSNDN
mgnify:CR=1 FL=1